MIGKRCQPFSHQGYCIESVLFSEINILKEYIKSLVSNLSDDVVSQSIDLVLTEISTAAKNLSHDLNKQIELSFNGQKNNRPEFEGLEFIDVMRSWESNNFKYERIMSKPLIQEFILGLEEKLQQSLFIRCSNNEEELSSKLLLLYFDFIQDLNDVFPSFKNLLIHLELFEEQSARQVA